MVSVVTLRVPSDELHLGHELHSSLFQEDEK